LIPKYNKYKSNLGKRQARTKAVILGLISRPHYDFFMFPALRMP